MPVTVKVTVASCIYVQMNMMPFFVSALATSYTVPQKQKALSWDEKAITIIKSEAEEEAVEERGERGEKGIKTEKRSLKTEL